MVVLLGCVLRLSFLTTQSLWFDEGYTAWVVSLKPANIVRMISADTAPPVYYLLLHAWCTVFGHAEWALRLPSALAGAAAMGLFPLLAWRVLKTHRAVLFTTVLFAIAEMPVAYAHEARFYSVMLLMAVITALAMLRLVLPVSTRQRATWITFSTLCCAISLYINNVMAIYIAAIFLAVLVMPGERHWRGRLFDLLVIGLATSVIFLPWVPTMIAQSRSLRGHFWIDAPTGWTVVQTFSTLCNVSSYADAATDRAMAAVVTILLVGSIAIGLKQLNTRGATIAMGMIALLPIAVIFVMSRINQPIFTNRAFIASCPFFVLLLAMPMAREWPRARVRKIAIILPVFWIIPALTSLRANYAGEHLEQWREACGVVSAIPSGEKPLLVFVANEGEMLWDYYGRGGDYSRRENQVGLPAGFFEPDIPRTLRRVQSDEDLALLKSKLADHKYQQVILFDSHYWWADSEHRALKHLQASYSQTAKWEFNQITVWVFAKPSGDPVR